MYRLSLLLLVWMMGILELSAYQIQSPLQPMQPMAPNQVLWVPVIRDSNGMMVFIPSMPVNRPPVGSTPEKPAVNIPPEKAKEKDKLKDAKKVMPDFDQQKAIMYHSLRQGNIAFSEGRYAGALKHYESAAQAVPTEPLPMFHLAQAYITMGQFPKAALSIQKGLRWMPRWVSADFSPSLLYGEKLDDMKKHLQALEEFVGKNPHDDSILLLLAYQYWFNDQKEEAIKLLKKAASLAMDTTLIDLFLKAELNQAKEPEKNIPLPK